MKRSIAVALILAFVLCGCSSGITQEAYDALVAERDAARNEIDVLNGQLDVYEQMLDEHDELISQRDTALAENENLRSQIAQYEQQINGQEQPATQPNPETEQPTEPPVEDPDAPATIENPELKTTGPITITKNPYGETVVEESRTWFIAHAENWDIVNWFFISPEDGKTYTVDEVRAMFPTFTLKSNSPDTMSFVNIPLGFDGWQLYARFENADGYADTAKAGVEVVSYADAYAPVFEEYDRFLSLPWEERYQVYNSGASSRNYFMYVTYGWGDYDYYTYALIDLDNNGIKELLLGGGGVGNSGLGEKGNISAMFTLVSAEPVKVFLSWENCEFFMLDDNSILNYGRNPGYSLTYFIGHISETEFIESNGIWETYWDTVYYYSSDGITGNADDKSISQEEYNTILSQYTSRIVDIPYSIHYIN